MPFFRYPDVSGLGQESQFEPPMRSDSASGVSLATDQVLSQDAYGSRTQVTIAGVSMISSIVMACTFAPASEPLCAMGVAIVVGCGLDTGRDASANGRWRSSASAWATASPRGRSTVARAVERSVSWVDRVIARGWFVLGPELEVLWGAAATFTGAGGIRVQLHDVGVEVMGGATAEPIWTAMAGAMVGGGVGLFLGTIRGVLHPFSVMANVAGPIFAAYVYGGVASIAALEARQHA